LREELLRHRFQNLVRVDVAEQVNHEQFSADGAALQDRDRHPPPDTILRSDFDIE
jgi:hypothetical protein